MDNLTIKGGNPLNGTIRISGAKNSALKLMAAALLTDEPVELRNMPNLADSRFMARLLSTLGVDVYWPQNENVCRLSAAEITSSIAPYDLVRKMRATFNVLGPLLARMGHATVSLPGGCAIGARPVNFHLEAFEAMGADILIEQGYVKAAALRGLKGAVIDLPFPSVGATEHTMMAATLANRGINPITGERAIEERYIRDVLSVMATCGLYDFAGEWAYKVGLPGKSGVSGGVFVTVPQQFGIAVFSPPLDERGNSVRGIRVCEQLSRRFGLHVYDVRSGDRRMFGNTNPHLQTPEEPTLPQPKIEPPPVPIPPRITVSDPGVEQN